MKGARDPALIPEMVREGTPNSALRLERESCQSVPAVLLNIP